MRTDTGTAQDVVDAAMTMAAEHLLEKLIEQPPRRADWSAELDCGTVRVRMRVEVVPTGLTAEQWVAAVIASDPAEPSAVRAAARLVAAGAPWSVLEEVGTA